MRPPMPRETYFATCAPGLEPVLHAEVRALKLSRSERQVGGVRFEGDETAMWTGNLWLRTAIRVLLRLLRYGATTSEELYAGARDIDWSRFVGPDSTVAVSAQCRDSALTHSQFIAQRVKDAIVDQVRERAGTRPSVDRDRPDLQVHVHVWRDRVTISADTSGDTLHKRGWRQHQGLAPLSETTAAGVLGLSEWDRRSPLLDPFCGTGTLVIEAALLAAGVPPGGFRDFGFERWPGHRGRPWREFVKTAYAGVRRPGKVRLIGSDVDADRVEEARANAAAARCDDWVEFERGAAEDFAPRRGWNGWVVTNLPYGERVGEVEDLEPTFRAFGEALGARCQGYHYALLSGAPSLVETLALPEARSIPLQNGGIETELLVGRIGE